MKNFLCNARTIGKIIVIITLLCGGITAPRVGAQSPSAEVKQPVVLQELPNDEAQSRLKANQYYKYANEQLVKVMQQYEKNTKLPPVVRIDALTSITTLQSTLNSRLSVLDGQSRPAILQNIRLSRSELQSLRKQLQEQYVLQVIPDRLIKHGNTLKVAATSIYSLLDNKKTISPENMQRARELQNQAKESFSKGYSFAIEATLTKDVQRAQQLETEAVEQFKITQTKLKEIIVLLKNK